MPCPDPNPLQSFPHWIINKLSNVCIWCAYEHMACLFNESNSYCSKTDVLSISLVWFGCCCRSSNIHKAFTKPSRCYVAPHKKLVNIWWGYLLQYQHWECQSNACQPIQSNNHLSMMYISSIWSEFHSRITNPFSKLWRIMQNKCQKTETIVWDLLFLYRMNLSINIAIYRSIERLLVSFRAVVDEWSYWANFILVEERCVFFSIQC